MSTSHLTRAASSHGHHEPPSAHRKRERRRWIALAVLCLGQLMMVLDATIVNVACPRSSTTCTSPRATSRG